MSTITNLAKTALGETTPAVATASAAPPSMIKSGPFRLPLQSARAPPSDQTGGNHRRSWLGGTRIAETGIKKAGKDGAVVLSITPGPIIGSKDRGKRDYTITLERDPSVKFVKKVHLNSQEAFHINTWRNAVRDGRKTCPLLYRKYKWPRFELGDYPGQDSVTTPSEPVIRSRQGSMKGQQNGQQNGQIQNSSGSRRSSMK